jgi:hypothetical protein
VAGAQASREQAVQIDVGDGGEGDVRVRSFEGEVVAWSRSAAARSATLANWVSDTGGTEGAFATELELVWQRSWSWDWS